MYGWGMQTYRQSVRQVIEWWRRQRFLHEHPMINMRVVNMEASFETNAFIYMSRSEAPSTMDCRDRSVEAVNN